MTRRRGITLVELLLALTIASLVMMAAGNAYVFGARTQQELGAGRDAVAKRVVFEASLRDLFEHAYLDADANNLNTYFISGDALASKSVGGSSSNSSSSGSGSGGDQSSLCFTTIGRRLPTTLLSSTDDFETNNEKYGPIGGVTEIQLGASPVGTPTGETEQGGLYLREQSPSDTDPTQGGEESKLSPDVDTISFEYYDGTQWLTTWDTTTMTTRRLPSAVRVTYRLKGDDVDKTLILAVPASDVTPDNPIQDTSA